LYQGVVVTLAGPDPLEGIEARVAVVTIRLEDLPLDQLVSPRAPATIAPIMVH